MEPSIIKPIDERYWGQINDLDPSALTHEEINWLVYNLLQRQKELTAMRKDMTILVKQWANLNSKAFVTDDQDTYYAGPTAANTKVSNTVAKNGWMIDVPAERVHVTRIRKAIEEMRTLGRRIPKDRKPPTKPKPQPIVKGKAPEQNTTFEDAFGI